MQLNCLAVSALLQYVKVSSILNAKTCTNIYYFISYLFFYIECGRIATCLNISIYIK